MEVKNCAKSLLVQDCVDLFDATSNFNNEDRAVFMLGAMPYICLVLNESYDWCKKADILLPPAISKNIIEKIRAKAKLFSNDKYLTYDQQNIRFEDILKSEHAYYKSSAVAFCPDIFISDVGTYMLGNHHIGNTIQYSYDFNVIKTPDKSLYEMGSEVYDFAVEIGRSFQYVIFALTGTPYKLNYSENSTKEYTDKDYTFKKSFVNIENLIVFSLGCRIRFLLYAFKEKCNTNSLLYLRLIYITFYSLKNDLLHLNLQCNAFDDTYYDRHFRNAMAHYSLYGKLEKIDIMPNVIGYGLIEKFFGKNHEDFVKIIEQKLFDILKTLENKFSIS